RQLADAQTQLTLSKHRQFAVAKLYELAKGDGETARKACVDLMKLDVKNAPTAAVRPPEPNAWDDPLEGGPGDEADEPVVRSIAQAAAFANRQWESRKTSRARGRAHRAARAPFASGEFTDRTPAPPRRPDWGGWPGSTANAPRR